METSDVIPLEGVRKGVLIKTVNNIIKGLKFALGTHGEVIRKGIHALSSLSVVLFLVDLLPSLSYPCKLSLGALSVSHSRRIIPGIHYSTQYSFN